MNIEIKDEFSKAAFKDENELLNAVQNDDYDFDNLKRFSDKYIKNKGLCILMTGNFLMKNLP